MSILIVEEGVISPEGQQCTAIEFREMLTSIVEEGVPSPEGYQCTAAECYEEC